VSSTCTSVFSAHDSRRHVLNETKPKPYHNLDRRCVAGWLSVRGLFAMRGPMRAGWLHSRGALRCTGCDAMCCDARDAMREPMRCELVAMQCAALRCTVRGLFAIQCAARGLVAFARCRRRHAFDGGIFRVGFFWVWLNTHQ
jgi:hypothetical protein